MSDYQRFGFGGSQYPLTSSTTNTLLKDADPSLFYVLDFFEAVLNTHLSARLAAQSTAAGLTIPAAVAYKLPHDPSPWMLSDQVRFPLLAVYRVSDDIEEHTRAYVHTTGKWECVYVLPPLDAAQIEQIGPIRKAVRDVLIDRTEVGHDPSYAGDEHVWSLAGLEQIGITRAEYGNWPAAVGNPFPALILTMQVKEQQTPGTGDLKALAGTDAHVDLTEPPADPFTDFVQAKT